jgi:hypothetical protein
MPEWAIVIFIAVAAFIVFLVLRGLIRVGDRKP